MEESLFQAVGISHHTLPADRIIRVKIAGRLLDLEHSGQRLGDFEARVSTSG